MAKKTKKALFKEQKEALKSARAAFSKFGEVELQGRKHIQKALLNCYGLYLEYEEDFIVEQCKKQDIKFKPQKPAKMVLMLAMQVSDECDERSKARIRTYVRVLKRFEELDYDIDEAEENLEEYGIDYFANPRKKKEKSGNVRDDDSDASDEDEDDDSDNSENDETNDLRDPDDNKNDDDEEEDDDSADDSDDDNDDTESSVTTSLSKSSKGTKSVSSKSSDKPLSEKFVNYFKQNGIKDENFVIWVKDGKVQKSNDSALLLKLKSFDFTDL